MTTVVPDPCQSNIPDSKIGKNISTNTYKGNLGCDYFIRSDEKLLYTLNISIFNM